MNIDNDSVSEFERNHDIDSFVFETPFTRGGVGGGQSQSGPREQWKRQTIIKSNISISIKRAFQYIQRPSKMFLLYAILFQPNTNFRMSRNVYEYVLDVK